jgi:competence protein ComEA
VREAKDADDVVVDRLRAVLTGRPVPGGLEVAGPRVGGDRRAGLVAVRPLGDLARVGEPLQWRDIIPAWPEEELETASFEPPEPWSAAGFPEGSAWASPPGSVPSAEGPSADSGPVVPVPAAVVPSASVASSGGVPLGVTEVVRPLGSGALGYPVAESPLRSRAPDERRPLAPPAWVLPEPEPVEEPADPLAGLGVSEPWGDTRWVLGDGDPAGLSGAGAFGGGREEGERRMGVRAFDPGRRGVRALAAVAVLVVLVAGFLAWRARPQVDPVVAAPSFDAGAGGSVASSAPASASASVQVVVAVAGKVRKPGLVRLPPGARVADALTAAGGAEPGVDVSMLNLARKVVDGELLLVGIAPSPGAGVPVVPPVGGVGATAGALVDLNTATLADLDTLPGVGPVLAQRILDARTAQGGFKAVSDLRKVNGIGDARFEQLKDLVTV